MNELVVLIGFPVRWLATAGDDATQARFLGIPGATSTAAAKCISSVTGHNIPCA
jgi:hypothetical protein